MLRRGLVLLALSSICFGPVASSRAAMAADAVALPVAKSHGRVIHKDHDPDILWKLVHQKCAVGLKPCTVYDPVQGIALLHSIEGQGQYLLIPTEKMAGMESAALLEGDRPNYFAAAWSFRNRVGQAYHRAIPDRLLSLAINSSKGRSQNQLHIHLDCLEQEVRALLDKYGDHIGPFWSYLPESIDGHHYRALYLSTLNGSPFRILAASLEHPAQEMGNHTLVLAPLGNGFALLDDMAHEDDRASGEELQDHACHALTENGRALMTNSTDTGTALPNPAVPR